MLSPDVVLVGRAVLCGGGERDTYLEWRMAQNFFECVVMLKNCSARIPTIASKTEQDLRSMMPGFPPWGWLQKAREVLWRAGKEHLRRNPGEADPSGDSGIHLECLSGFDLQLMSWGDGTRVPTLGNHLVIVGTDNNNVLHVRVFDQGGDWVTDTDETKLPPAQAQAISALKQQLPDLLLPHVLTDAEKARVLGEVSSILTVRDLSVQIPNCEETRQRLIGLVLLRDELDDYMVRIARDPCMATAFASEEAGRPRVAGSAGTDSATDDAGGLSRDAGGRASGGGEEGRVPQANAGKHPKTDAPPEPPIILGGPDDDLTVCGKRKPPLPPAQYRVVKALVEARGERLSKDTLRGRTKDNRGNVVEDPVGALKRLRKRDRDFKRIIDMAGGPGRGYGLKDWPPTPTHKS
jgi:hypothetical protein